MWSAATVLMCALSVLGRDARTFPPIEFVEILPSDASRKTEAFTRSTSNVIYLVTSSEAFERARRTPGRCDDSAAVAKIASMIVHEEWHLRHGLEDESGAYDAQLQVLMRLGIGPGNPTYDGVWRSMRAVLTARQLAARQPLLQDAHLTGPSRWAPARTPPSAQRNPEP
jgi:hypothetical protein